MVKFPLKFFYNIGVISEILELPRFCPDFLQKKFYNIKPRPQSYEKYKNLCSQACEYKSFWKTLVFTSFVKFNPIMPVLTCKYKLLKYTKLKNSFIEIQSTLNQICKSFTQALWLVKSSFLAKKFPI